MALCLTESYGSVQWMLWANTRLLMGLHYLLVLLQRPVHHLLWSCKRVTM